jgi:hypothetical protein
VCEMLSMIATAPAPLASRMNSMRSAKARALATSNSTPARSQIGIMKSDPPSVSKNAMGAFACLASPSAISVAVRVLPLPASP